MPSTSAAAASGQGPQSSPQSPPPNPAQPVPSPVPTPAAQPPAQQKQNQPKVKHGLTIQDWTSLILSFVGVVVACVFGAWAIRSYNAALTANQYAASSLQAAQDPDQLHAIELNSELLLLQLCQSGGGDNKTCALAKANIPLAQIATELVTALSTPTIEPSGANPSSSAGIGELSLGAEIGIIVGAIVLVASIVALIWTKCMVRQRREDEEMYTMISNNTGIVSSSTTARAARLQEQREMVEALWSKSAD